MSTPAGQNPPLRIGNQERAAACAALDAHLEAGRLDADEFGDRYARAVMARTRDELDALFVDLPAPHAFPPAPVATAPAGPRDWARYLPVSVAGRLVILLLIMAALSVLIPLALGAALVWFVIVPLVGGRGCRMRRRSRGWPGPAWR